MTGGRTWMRVLPVVALLVLWIGIQGAPGTAEPPSMAVQSAQLLPPGTQIQEVALSGGGYLRAIEIERTTEGLRLTGRSGIRTLPGIAANSDPVSRRLWLGTDHLGRDMLARTARGARTSLTVALIAALVGGLLGTVLGLATAGAPGWLQAGVDWWTDGVLGLPRLLILLVLAVAFRGTPMGVGLAIGLTSWMGLSRLIRAEVRHLMGQGFMDAARTGGSGILRTAVVHLLPHVALLLGVGLPLLATDAVLLEATLGFLGIPSSPDADSWGAMIADGRRTLPRGWWISILPGLSIVATALAFHRGSRFLRRDPRS